MIARQPTPRAPRPLLFEGVPQKHAWIGVEPRSPSAKADPLLRNTVFAASLRVVLPCLLALPACAAAAPPDTLPRLRDAMHTEVASPAQNAEHSQLAQVTSREKLLSGMTRDEVIEKLGKGEPCSQHALCQEKEFDPNDFFYEIGTAGAYVRYRPVLIVGFNDWGKVERTFVLEVR